MLRVTRKDEKVVRENKRACKEVSFLQTKKEGVLFRDPKLTGLAEEYMAVQREYEAAQAEIAKQVVEMATTYTPVVQDCVTLLAERIWRALPPSHDRPAPRPLCIDQHEKMKGLDV